MGCAADSCGVFLRVVEADEGLEALAVAEHEGEDNHEDFAGDGQGGDGGVAVEAGAAVEEDGGSGGETLAQQGRKAGEEDAEGTVQAGWFEG